MRGLPDTLSREQLILRVRELEALINAPQTTRFLEATRCEVAHQVERWGNVHDRAKRPADWFWLVGYLAGKALHAHVAGDIEKALHHTISSAAALGNWHAAIALGFDSEPSSANDLHAYLAQQFGTTLEGLSP